MTEQVLDRMLRDVFADGPQAARPEVVRSAFATARKMRQRTARFPRLDRRAWPPQRNSVADPNVRQGLRLVLMAALALIAIAASVVVGSRLLQHPAPVTLDRATIVTATLLPTPADSAISLRDGRVLIAGAPGTGLGYIFDPKAGGTTTLGGPSNSMVEGAVDLGDGRAALLVWEYADPTPKGHSAIWLVDLASGIATRSGDTIHPRFEAAVARLADGRVALGGGVSNPEDAVALSSAEAFDPVSGTFAELPQMSIPWPGSGSTPLGDGRLLLESQTGYSSAFVYVYSPATGAVVQLGEVGRSRDAQLRAPVRLADGRIWILGPKVGPQLCGIHGSEPIRTWLYDPATNALTEGFQIPHAIDVAVPLVDGRILVAGHWQTMPGSCGGSLDYVFDWWIGIHDPRTGLTTQSPDAITGVGDLPIDTDTAYAAGALLPDGRVMLVSQEGPDRPRVRVDIVDVAP